MLGMLIGLASGLCLRMLLQASPALKGSVSEALLTGFDTLGQVFLRLLCFVVAPLVFASLALAVVQLGPPDRLGRLAAKTFLLFALNMVIGVALGLLIINGLRPGERLDSAQKEQLLQQYGTQAQEARTASAAQDSLGVKQLLETFLPRNLLKAVVDFQIMPLIVFALLVGLAGTQLREDRRRRLQEGLEMMAELMTRVVHFAMLLAPYAVGAMMCSLVAKLGLDVLKAVLLFVAGTLGGMAVHLLGTLSLLLKLLSRWSPVAFFRAASPILITAFSTSSSNATLPTTIQVSREKLGVSASTAGFVLPLGATMNMSGTALYEGCVVLFVAQVYGVDLGLGSQINLLVLTVLSAVAVAGLPGASLPLLVGLLVTFKVPPEGLALILGVDRLLDMCRTTLNVAADVATACIIDQPARRMAPATSPEQVSQ
jgi:DAACS family dicarboxylate/amino acid:cation (Na+ or H+) symporter